MTDLKFITDELHDFYRISLGIRGLLHEEQTPFQHIRIVDTAFFGRAMLLDGIIQLTELDNHAYHEMISHVALLANPNPRRVMIVGGGDGGTLREVLRHESVEEVFIVELDARVVELSREYFSDLSAGYDDPRAKLTVRDAFPYLAENEGTFDVIIADTTDPVGEAAKLFSLEFYELMNRALTPGGVIVTQCEQMYFDAPLIREMLEIGRGLRKHADYFYTLVPTYPGGSIGFLYLSDTPWQAGLGKAYPPGLRYLNAGVHAGAFALPEFVQEALG